MNYSYPLIILIMRDVAVLFIHFFVLTVGTGAPSKRTYFPALIGVFSVHSIGATGAGTIGVRSNIILTRDRYSLH